jgi:hypothetical protein
MRVTSSAAFGANLSKDLTAAPNKGQVCLSSDYFETLGVRACRLAKVLGAGEFGAREYGPRNCA